MFMAKLLYGATKYRTRKFLVSNHAKLPEIEYKSLVDSNALCKNIFLRIWIFFSIHLKNKYETLAQFAYGSEWFGAKV